MIVCILHFPFEQASVSYHHHTSLEMLFPECVESPGLLIQNNGLSVCGATPQKVVPLIAAQISNLNVPLC